MVDQLQARGPNGDRSQHCRRNGDIEEAWIEIPWRAGTTWARVHCAQGLPVRSRCHLEADDGPERSSYPFLQYLHSHMECQWSSVPGHITQWMASGHRWASRHLCDSLSRIGLVAKSDYIQREPSRSRVDVSEYALRLCHKWRLIFNFWNRKKLMDNLNPRARYEELVSVRLVGMMLVVIVEQELRKNVIKYSTQTVGTGALNFMVCKNSHPKPITRRRTHLIVAPHPGQQGRCWCQHADQRGVHLLCQFPFGGSCPRNRSSQGGSWWDHTSNAVRIRNRSTIHRRTQVSIIDRWIYAFWSLAHILHSTSPTAIYFGLVI